MSCSLPYWQAALIALDQFVNAVCFRGWPDETLSSRAHRMRLLGRPLPATVIDRLFRIFGDMDHCRESYESERKGRQLPPEARP